MARLGADGETQGTKGLFPVGVSVAGLTQDDNLVCCSSPALDSLDQPHRQRESPASLPSLHWHCITRLSATGCGILWDAAGNCGVPTLSVNPREAAQWDRSLFPHSEAAFPLSSAAHQFFSFSWSQLSPFHSSHIGFAVL